MTYRELMNILQSIAEDADNSGILDQKVTFTNGDDGSYHCDLYRSMTSGELTLAPLQLSEEDNG